MNIKFKVTGKKPYNVIYVRFYKGSHLDISASTELGVKPEHWDYKKHTLKNVASFTNFNLIKRKLLQVEDAIYEAYQKDFVQGAVIDSIWLKRVVFQVFNRETHEANKETQDHDIYFSDWSAKWINEAVGKYVRKNGKLFSEKEENKYLFAVDKIKRYETYSRKRIKFSMLDKNLKLNLKTFLCDKEFFATNTVTEILNRISFLHKRALNADIKVNKDWDELPNNVNSDFEEDLTFLDNDEIQAFYDVKLKSKALDIARDNFIIGLRSGLRVSDYLVGLHKDHLKSGKIMLETQKTKTKVMIPVHPQVREILMKWNGLPPKIHGNHLGERIKKIAKKAGINQKIFGGVIKKIELWDKTEVRRKVFGEYEKWELIVTHTARRSFATNLYLDGVDNQTIMEVGGWSSEKMMLHYVKKHGDKASKTVAANWGIKEIKPVIFKNVS